MKAISSLLEQINSPDDLRQLPINQLPDVAEACRQYLIDTLDHCGGHFAASLGAIELTIALHYCLNTPTDTIVWDVGHQAYIHKILTGRKHRLHTIKQQHGLAPFLSPQESRFDSTYTGHACTAISTALGIALAKTLAKDCSHTVAIMGDGGLTGGMAFEALNHAATTQVDLTIVINDNDMSISENVGQLSGQPLADFFMALGLPYKGPINGHDLNACLETLKANFDQPGPRVIHFKTRKGQGYPPAEQNPIQYHHVAANFRQKVVPTPCIYANIFGQWLCDAARQYPNLVAITPAMREGSDLVQFQQQFPKRYIDTGIAEQHALALASGLAIQGQKPVVAIYSTFLQRGYDQLIHDIALANANVLIAIDRAGLVGSDGATHQGIFDISYLRSIPNVSLLAPANANDLYHMLSLGLLHAGPVCIRYPKAPTTDPIGKNHIDWGTAKVMRQGEKIALLNFGPLLDAALTIAEPLNATVVDMRFIKPLDQACLDNISKTHNVIITLEDHVIAGGAGSAISEYFTTIHYKGTVHHLGIPDQFIDHATREQQLEQCGLTAKQLLNNVYSLLHSMKKT